MTVIDALRDDLFRQMWANTFHMSFDATWSDPLHLMQDVLSLQHQSLILRFEHASDGCIDIVK